jgi:hypothetical protein
MTFFFYLLGNNTGFLNIQTKQEGKDPELILSRYGNHGMTWQRVQVYINITGEYQVMYWITQFQTALPRGPVKIISYFQQVIITGTVGDHELRHAPGFDDISFRNQTCNEDSTGMSIRLLGRVQRFSLI